ncbi:MAG: TlpA disulfide reductase family protein [Bryobacteraceae bacterium]
MKLVIALVVCLGAFAQGPVPSFTLQDAAGKRVSLQQFRGKVVLLNFWATWCGGCKKELPQFDALQRRMGKRKLAVLAVSVDEKGWDVVKPFVASLGKVSYRIVLADEALARDYAVQSLPATFLIDKQGNVAAQYTGLVDGQNIEEKVRGVLAAR